MNKIGCQMSSVSAVARAAAARADSSQFSIRVWFARGDTAASLKLHSVLPTAKLHLTFASIFQSRVYRGAGRPSVVRWQTCSPNPNPARNRWQDLFPAASPYVLAIGGTQWNNPADPSGGMRGWSDGPGASGGGFSWQWAAPDYQPLTVAPYLKQSKATQTDPKVLPQERAQSVRVQLWQGSQHTAVGSRFTCAGRAANHHLLSRPLACL
jgi:hypothetical protein